MATFGPLRTIRQWLTKPSSVDERGEVLLECGHTAQTTPRYKRARCAQCRRSERLRQAGQRIRRAIVRRPLTLGATPIFIRVEADGQKDRRRARTGYRVLRVQVVDVTPGPMRRDQGPRALACESLVIACEAAGVEMVRAKLLEMGEALDGVVLVT